MTTVRVKTESELPDDELDLVSLRCFECEVNFTSKHFLYNHLYHHIKQPFVKLDRVQHSNHPPLKITLKNRSGNSFEIVSSPASSVTSEQGCRSTTSLEDLDDQEEHQPLPTEERFEEDEAKIRRSVEAAEELEKRIADEQEQAEYDPFEGIDSNENTRVSSEDLQEGEQEEGGDQTNVSFSPNFADVIGGTFLTGADSPAIERDKEQESDKNPSAADAKRPPDDKTELRDIKIEETEKEGNTGGGNTAGEDVVSNGNGATPEYGHIPGAEPTPPPEPSPTEYPKIKIKTTGLFKDPEPQRCTITEITDDNPNGDPNIGNGNRLTPVWTTPSLEDPLKLPDNDDSNLLTLFSNNDQRAKDLGFSTSTDNEFISLDRFDERNRGAMQLYNPNSAVATSSSLDSLTGLPMQALAQQVSRLQPSGSQSLHQQNVLINIQQFPSGPPQPTYQPPPMYGHYPPHPGQPPMHQPYQYQPPNPMYYPPAPGYPPQHMPPPPPHSQMGQMQPPPPMGQQPQMGGSQPPNSLVPSSQSQPMPNQMQQPPNQMQGGYRPPMPQKPPVPRGPQPGAQRMPPGPRGGGQMNQRAPMARPRAPMVRPRATGVQPVRGAVRPRMAGPQNGVRPGQQTSPIKRNTDQMNALQAKKKRLDVLTPSDKDDDDCQVICMQPKNTDGGLPQIESVQGGTSAESSIMHLSDSITLSVRNPPPKPVVAPQKSDAKAVANILATRGITVTATPKPKETAADSPTKSTPPALPTSLSLNGAVSIVAAPKGNGSAKPASENLPTVDLTDDSAPSKPSISPQKNRPGLPYRCDLCPAQYPNAIGLNKHRQTYHKTTGGMCELGVPLINLKQPGIMQKLGQLGISNYIPLPSSGPDGTFALPIISTKQPGNVAALGAVQMLSLGPVRSIPKPAHVSAPGGNKPTNK